MVRILHGNHHRNPLRSGTEKPLEESKTKGDLVPDKWGDKIKLHIDGIPVTNIDALEKTLPHSIVFSESTSEQQRDALFAYLRQVDGTEGHNTSSVPDGGKVEFNRHHPLPPQTWRPRGSSSSILIEFADNAVTERYYQLEYRQTRARKWETTQMPKQGGGGIVRYSLGGLEADKSYEVRVRAFNFAGGSEYSNTAKAGTLPKGHLFGYTGDTPFRDKTKINAFGTEMVVSDQSIRFFSDYGNKKKGHFWLTEQVPTTAFETEFIVQRTDYQEWDGSPFYGGALQLIFQNSSNQILPSGGDSGYEGIPEAKAKFSFGFGSINSGVMRFA